MDVLGFEASVDLNCVIDENFVVSVPDCNKLVDLLISGTIVDAIPFFGLLVIVESA